VKTIVPIRCANQVLRLPWEICGTSSPYARPSRASQRLLRYQYTDVPSLEKLAREHGKEFADFFWQHLTEIAIDHQNGVFAGTNSLVETIGGLPPLTLAQFVEKHRSELTSQPSSSAHLPPGESIHENTPLPDRSLLTSYSGRG
jgi:hypothetical protein